eukprot:TRINITY_DN4803_c0_g1_i1.p1 TRINITY_DN4803_c0_g1~~TRINITY_DN4803_c0_g1_i1.p1  ORF type:complete len:383 (+),score=77.39 TRINITY_DN4803_c0_g1_i1:93-1241(+)
MGKRSSNSLKSKSERQFDQKLTKYTSFMRILLLGDGDFSFALGLARHCGGHGSHIIATSFDSKQAVVEKYHCSDTLSELKKAGVRVLHGVDATKLNECSGLQSERKRVDRIVFNFPHTGLQRTHLNRALVKSFLHEASTFVKPDGEIHVTIKNGPPYNRWGIEKLGEEAGCSLMEKRRFLASQFPGYHHQTTEADAKPLDSGACLTFVFIPSVFDPSSIDFSSSSSLSVSSCSSSSSTSCSDTNNKESEKTRRRVQRKGKHDNTDSKQTKEQKGKQNKEDDRDDKRREEELDSKEAKAITNKRKQPQNPKSKKKRQRALSNNTVPTSALDASTVPPTCSQTSSSTTPSLPVTNKKSQTIGTSIRDKLSMIRKGTYINESDCS